MSTQHKTRTITLTGRQPVRIREDQWPILAQGAYSDSRPQSTRTVEIWLRVRRHTDGRAIVYAGYTYEPPWQGEEPLRVRVGDLIGAGDDLVRAIQRVGADLADRIAGKPGAQRLRDVIDACIADLPAEEI